MREHSINQLNNFMGGWYLEDTSICDQLIEYHKTSPNKTKGHTSKGVNLSVKDSTDVIVENPLASRYVDSLMLAANQYKLKYPWCDAFAPWSIVQKFSVQHYAPNGGYFGWHTERSNTNPNVITRHLVFMTYLNDVSDDGETEFYHQQIKVKPEKGLTLIWPSDWTFVHRGITSPTQEKYIITGWFNYM
jgi:hypothetical protein